MASQETKLPELLFAKGVTETRAHLHNFYDGDTCRFTAPVPGSDPPVLVTLKARMKGIDTAELRAPKDSAARKLAYLARDLVREKLDGRCCTVRVCGQGKYNRYLLEIDMPDSEQTLADWLCQERLAFRYDGKKRRSIEDFEKLYQERVQLELNRKAAQVWTGEH